jgi:hypothetical protein
MELAAQLTNGQSPLDRDAPQCRVAAHAEIKPHPSQLLRRIDTDRPGWVKTLDF